MLKQIIYRFEIAICSVSRNRSYASRTDIADLSEILTRIDIGNMYLAGRNADGLDCVENCDARMGICAGIDDDAVKSLIRRLDIIDEVALVIRLAKFDGNIFGVCVIFYLFEKIGVGFLAVVGWLTNAEHIEIRAIDD